MTATPVPFGPLPQRAEAHRVAMRDGIHLATDLYLPDRPHRLPTVLIRTPYDKTHPDTLVPDLADRFTEAGFAVVAQDVRGKIRSEGIARPFVHELADGADTCDWIVEQPWSNGEVFCWGNSYYGFTAWATVASGHSAVRAAVTRYITTDIGGTLLRHNGVLRLGPMLEWLRTTWSGRANLTDTIDWQQPLPELLRTTPFWRQLRFGGRDPVASTIPVLHCAGWFDLFQSGQLADHHRSPAGRLIIAATDHQDDHWQPDAASPDHLTDPHARTAMLDRSLPPVIDFLRGRPAPAVRWELTGAGWRTDWPPATAPLHLHPTPDGTLAERPATGSVQWTHDPTILVPTRDTNWWRPLLDPPSSDEPRPDAVTFTSRSWAADLDLVGPVTLRTRLTAPGTLIAQLDDLAPNGRAQHLLEAPRHGIGAVTVPLGHLGYRLRAGHRLRLRVASSCFPSYPLDPRPYQQTLRTETTMLILARTS